MQSFLLNLRRIVKSASDFSDLSLADIKASTLGPYAVASLGVNGGLVDLSRANKVINVSYC
jgi:hypothetical protein